MKKNGFETFEVDETLNIQECKDAEKDENVQIVESNQDDDDGSEK